MTKIVELRPNKNLFNAKFEKYQFSAECINTKLEIPLDTKILRIEPSSSQDSFLEARLFAFHNHLFKNPFDKSCWFIDVKGAIQRFQNNGNLSKIYLSPILKLENIQPIYNPSIGFGSENVVVLSNGAGSLEILIFNNNQCQNYIVNDDIDASVILDVLLDKNSSELLISLCKIDEYNNKKCTKIFLLTYFLKRDLQEVSNIELKQKQIIRVKGTVECVNIEGGSFIDIISQEHVEFEFDSSNPMKSKKQVLSEEHIKIPKYCWSQDEESITIYTKIPEVNKNHVIKVDVSPLLIHIKAGDDDIIKGKLSNKLESELTTWKRKDDNTLEIELFKSETGLMWNELIQGDTGGEYLPNEVLAAEIHEKLFHLCSDEQEKSPNQPVIGFNSEQLEECDLQGGDNLLQRINCKTHSLTHMSLLGTSSRIIFCQKLDIGYLLCLRYDHDGCIWKLTNPSNEECNFDHICTYPGFGYVEASKSNKKFCVSPDDQSYIAIIEHSRHIFLYEKPAVTDSIGRQRILDLECDSSPIFGAVAFSKYLMILTKEKLYELQIYS